MEAKRHHTDEPPALETRFHRINWVLLGVGLASVLLGFGVLWLADPDASNLAGRLAPLLIVAGYATVFIGLICRAGGGPARESAPHHASRDDRLHEPHKKPGHGR